MYNKKQDKPISLVFITSLVVVFVASLYYVSIPSNRSIMKNKTFEEQLEYGKIPYQSESDEENYPFASFNFKNIPEVKQEAAPAPVTVKTSSDKETLTDLLDELSTYPANSIHFVEIMVNKMLIYLGYPPNTVRVLSNENKNGASKIQGGYMAAYFDIPSGNIYIDSRSLYSLDGKLLTAILAHELDHFDKMAKIAKSMGSTEFVSLLESKKIAGVNREFWGRVSRYADTKNFDSKYYQDALLRLISKHELELTSSYSDFYKLSENMRNPLEISAYNVSDYIETYYKINKSEGPMRQLTKKFNNVDWAVYNFVSSKSNIGSERIALFDYFFMLAVCDRFPELKKLRDYCINNKDGDLTSFWLEYEKKLPEFYVRGKQLDMYSYNIIMQLLSKTEDYAKNGANSIEILNALKYKINTLYSNLVYPNAVKNLDMTTEDYLRYAKNEGIVFADDELNCILILLCIENNFTTAESSKAVSLSSLKIPPVLVELYPPLKKRNRLYFIYNNAAFRKAYESAKSANSNIRQDEFLEQMIDSKRLNVRIGG